MQTPILNSCFHHFCRPCMTLSEKRIMLRYSFFDVNLDTHCHIFEISYKSICKPFTDNPKFYQCILSRLTS